MPDWSYRTLLRPALFQLAGERARRVAVGSLRFLSGAPGGLGLIDFLGHMRAPTSLGEGMPGPWALGPVGLGALVDPHGRAAPALARFGTGFLEVGPVSAAPPHQVARFERDLSHGTIDLQGEHATTLEALLDALRDSPRPTTPLWIRLDTELAPDAARSLRPHAAAFLLEIPHDLSMEEVTQRVRVLVNAAEGACPVLISVAADCPDAVLRARAALEGGAHGLWIRDESHPKSGVTRFGSMRASILATVRTVRAALPPTFVIVAGGVSEPEHARQFLEAGAQLVAVEAGLVFSGPGLIKRTNDAFVRARRKPDELLPTFSLDSARSAWFWGLMLGLAMFVGGLLALAIASTRVVLPYDEALCGLTRAQMMEVNPRLLPFMAHDRVTLAGTMLSVGVLYSSMAWHAMRTGAHWAHVALLMSAFTGFLSMFLFLGFGYFDPFHAFVTGVLFQFLLLAAVMPLGPAIPQEAPEWNESAAWRRAQWGQLVFVLLGTGLLLAGLGISYIGITQVFVPEDLAFMRTTAAELGAAHERLVGLVAHDRATLGGMLLANGWAVLLAALWGFRADAAWLWRALALAGNFGFFPAILVHYLVGYENLFHLAPAFLGWALWWLGLLLARGWMARAPVTAALADAQ